MMVLVPCLLAVTCLSLPGNPILGPSAIAGEAESDSTSRAPAAGEVFQRHFKEMGGRKALEEVKTMRAKGTGKAGQETLQFEFLFKAPGQVLLAGSIQDQVVLRMGRDEKGVCWRQDPGGVRDLEGEPARELFDLTCAFHPPMLLQLEADAADGATTCERRREGDREWLVVSNSSPRQPFPSLCFDAVSGRLGKVDSLLVEDYRAVGGLQLPHRISAPGNTVFSVAEFQINPDLPANALDRPRGKTQMPAGVGGDAGGGGPGTLTNHLSAPGKQEIVRHPAPGYSGSGMLREMPVWNPKSQRHAQVDLRGKDVSGLDLTTHLTNLLHADFDSKTVWPKQLPEGYDRERVLALGRDPGLGMRELHRRGLTGKGVGVGIIDQPLLVDHVEYRDRLRLYEEIHSPGNAAAQMHGPAVTSIAAGKNVGVAPDADVYYIAEQHGTFVGEGKFEWDFAPLAESIDRLLAINATLPTTNRIRVISISVGWSAGQKGYEQTMAAAKRAEAQGIFIISTALEETHHLAFHGLGREALADPNDAASFGPGSWWAGPFWSGRMRFPPGQRLLVPMDSRAIAGPTSQDDYAFYSSAGWSWSVPWIAGLYAVACQVAPDITPAVFWAKAMETGRINRLEHNGKPVEFGTIVDPVRLIESLQQGADAKPR